MDITVFAHCFPCLPIVYFLGVQVFSWVCLIPWIYRDSYHSGILESDAIGRPWWAIFTTASLFSNVGITLESLYNLGFTLTPDAMISFQQAVFPLLLLSFVIIAG